MVFPLVAAGISLLGNLSAAQTAQTVGKANAKLSRQAARDARQRGVYDTRRLRLQSRALASEYTADLAGSNVAIGEGTAAEVAGDIAYVSELDAISRMNDAAREAWSHRARAEIGEFEADAQSRVFYARGAGSVLEGLGGYYGSAP